MQAKSSKLADILETLSAKSYRNGGKPSKALENRERRHFSEPPQKMSRHFEKKPCRGHNN